MTISKRLRFEILRRDSFKCYYCHNAEDGLHIDHVVPQALGGTDDAENLVAACADCNSGKTSTASNSELVADVNRQVAIEKAARERAMKLITNAMRNFEEFEEDVAGLWRTFTPSYSRDRVSTADQSYILYSWFDRGIPLSVIEKGIRIAVGNSSIGWGNKWNYANGVINNTVDAAQISPLSEAAAEIEWREGFERGEISAQRKDLVALLIDGRTSPFWDRMSLVAS